MCSTLQFQKQLQIGPWLTLGLAMREFPPVPGRIIRSCQGRRLFRCWLIDLAREVPSSWDLQGFDVSTSHFPVAANLPINVSLGILDAFDEVPAKFVAKFNLIHVRAFAVVVKGGNVSPLLQNLARMLSMLSLQLCSGRG